MPGISIHVVDVSRGVVAAGMKVELRPPVRLDAILDAERAAKISLPNDYRALLTITTDSDDAGWDHESLRLLMEDVAPRVGDLA